MIAHRLQKRNFICVRRFRHARSSQRLRSLCFPRTPSLFFAKRMRSKKQRADNEEKTRQTQGRRMANKVWRRTDGRHKAGTWWTKFQGAAQADTRLTLCGHMLDIHCRAVGFSQLTDGETVPGMRECTKNKTSIDPKQFYKHRVRLRRRNLVSPTCIYEGN